MIKNIAQNVKRKLILLSVVILLIMSCCTTSFANQETITEDFRIQGYASFNGETSFSVGLVLDDGSYQSIGIDASKYGLPSILRNYTSDVLLRVTYVKETYEVTDCKLINLFTGEVIEDKSEENIKKLFDIENGKTINEKNAWVETIKLSELKEKDVYKYTATETCQFPKIENDIGKNCIVYLKQRSDREYEKKIYTGRTVESSAAGASHNEYEKDEFFHIMYEIADNNKLLKLIDEDELVRLSKFSDGDIVDHKFEDYIYNDTDKKVTLTVINYNVEKEFQMEKDELCGFDWMVDEVILNAPANNNSNNNNSDNSNSKNENKVTQTENKVTSTENTTTQENKISTTSNVASNKITSTSVNKTTTTNEIKQEIPEAGASYFPILILIIALTYVGIRFKKYYDLSEDMKLK